LKLAGLATDDVVGVAGKLGHHRRGGTRRRSPRLGAGQVAAFDNP
jgi:hypothetical protein